MNQLVKLAVPLLSIGLTLLGCSSADEPIVDAAPPAAALLPAPASPEAAPATKATGAPDAAEPQKPAAAAANYTPPFPQRLELFEPPQRAVSTARRDVGDGETIELKGFIEVDEPRVILSIDGVVSSIPAGGEKYGVRVLSIQPPTVVLQRGGSPPWPATLE